MTNFPEIGFQISPYAQILINPLSNTILAANNEACRLLRESFANMRGQTFSSFCSDRFPDWVIFTEEVLQTGEAWSDALELIDKEDNRLSIEVSARVTQVEDDKVVQLSFQSNDHLQWYRDRSDAIRHYRSGITHWDRIAKVFREFERENHLILDAAGEGIYGVDCDGNATFVNAAAERMLGWKKEELIGRSIHNIIHHTHRNGEHFHVHDCSIYQAFRDGIKRNIEDEVFWKKCGKAIDVEYTSTPIKDEDELVGAVVIFRDVTQKRIDQKRLMEALDEVKRLKTRLEMENAYLQEEISSEFNHHQIVGKSPAIQQVIQQIGMVAPTDATVLITGESGTGKELIARAIHEESSRSHRSLIRVNCAAIPGELFESEFFGHVKGAFTGATDSRMGRFELADGGTIFLDEVGEIPLSLQGKLLRVLQEQQFERVGDSKTRTVDVRIIAATNKRLKELALQGKFREDLYFRFNVFPIESVPLRERLGDIPLLAQHLLNKAMIKANKHNLKIPMSEIELLKSYRWPGNIRELENIIERQVILSKGDTLTFRDLPNIKEAASQAQELHIEGSNGGAIFTDQEIKDNERRNIVIALKKSKGKVSGKHGAAEILNLKPTTLTSRIKKYGIDLREYREL